MFRAKFIELSRCVLGEIETGELLHKRLRLVPERLRCIVLGNVDQQPYSCLRVTRPVVTLVHRMKDTPSLDRRLSSNPPIEA